MFSLILKKTIFRNRMIALREKITAYDSSQPLSTSEEYQLNRFNEVWLQAQKNIPFYQSWAQEHNLPTQITSLKEIYSFPALTKDIILSRSDEIFTDLNGKRIESAYTTGGSTGKPAKYPRAEQDAVGMYTNTYVGRSWWGIEPFDSYVHVWGHSHLFNGSKITKIKRLIHDYFANAKRVNAYDLSMTGISAHIESINKKNPKYIIGYTSAIYKIARHAKLNNINLRNLSKLKGVIVTAETVTPADVSLIYEVFGVPVIIEYGSAETGVMATSRNETWNLHVLWKSFLIQVHNKNEIFVTTLDNRIFPLINYAIGDTALVKSPPADSAFYFAAITGRAQDTITVSNESNDILELSAILPVHILKSHARIKSVQYQQHNPGSLNIFVTADESLDLIKLKDFFDMSLKLDHPSYKVESVTFEQLPEPMLTPSGKQALFINP